MPKSDWLVIACPLTAETRGLVNAELIALARSRPGQLNFASSGIGGSNHMAGELLNVMAKINIVHVPYKGKNIVARLNTEVAKLLAGADLKSRFVNEGLEPIGGSQEEFARFIRDETTRYAKVIKTAGIKPL